MLVEIIGLMPNHSQQIDIGHTVQYEFVISNVVLKAYLALILDLYHLVASANFIEKGAPPLPQ